MSFDAALMLFLQQQMVSICDRHVSVAHNFLLNNLMQVNKSLLGWHN